jgi:large subunit ribosomal protein L23
MKISSNIIVKPLISEKSFNEAKTGRYTFIVASHATKTDIKNAIEKLFNVNVTRVFSANIKSSKTRTTRMSRRIIDASYKKARVMLKKGEKLDIFEEQTDDKKRKKEGKKENKE